MHKRMTLDRRTFFKLLGAGSATTLFPLLRSSRALSQAGPIPRRIVFFYGGDGLLEGSWQPRAAAGQSNPTETQFRLGDILSPLGAHQQDMILFENLDMVTVRFDSTPPSNAHTAGSTHAMTAASRFNGNLPGQISIDQHIAREINRAGPLTQLPSLEILCSARLQPDAAFTSGPGQLVPFMQRPREIYNRLFPDGVEASGDDSSVERHDRVFDFVRGDASRWLDKLSGDDRVKLEQHLQTVDDLHSRLGLRRGGSGGPAFDPELLGVADRLDWSSRADRDRDWPERWDVSTDLNLQLAVAALHADVTRVVTIDMDNPPGPLFGYRNGMFNSNDPHDLTHKVHANTAQSRDPNARRAIFDEGQLKLRKLRQLLDGLAERRESDGQRLLDHTVVAFVSQIANGSHSVVELPWFTVGNFDGAFRTGRWLRHGRSQDPNRGWLSHGRPHNDLFITLANAMGVGGDRFGDRAVATGPIREMLA